jgi:hypothetical protein
MKKQPNASLLNKSLSNVALHQLVDKLIVGLLPATVSRKSFIVNDVPPQVTVHTNEDTLSLILSTLLTRAVTSTQSQCVRVDADETGDCTVIKLKDRTGSFYSAVCHSLKQEQLMAEKIGGFISINQHSNGDIITSFRFGKQVNAA